MVRRPLRSAATLGGVLLAGALIWSGSARFEPGHRHGSLPTGAASGAPPLTLAPAIGAVEPGGRAGPGTATDAATLATGACAGERPLAAPSGSPPRLGCGDARRILSEMRELFAGTAHSPRPADFSKLLVGWLDPHGLWSAAPDSPLGRVLKERSAELLAELEQPKSDSDVCPASLQIGERLRAWTRELAVLYDQAAAKARPATPRRAASVARESAFQDDPVTDPARVLSRRLGERVAQFAAVLSTTPQATRDAARSRYFPELSSEQWAEVVLAAAVRAYVPLVDPHGDWAPFEEEWSLYAGDPGLDGAPRLWRDITRTAVGVRIVDGAAAPLAVGDLVLSVDGSLLAGMPLEQAEQLARLEPAQGTRRRVQLLRSGRTEPEDAWVEVGGSVKNADPGDSQPTLETEVVRYGEGRVLIVRIPEVPDGLGEELGRLLREARTPELAGVLLDLRGNGGGSTDAAAAVLGLFLPGAPLFPLAKDEQLSEVLRAVEPPLDERHTGPVATFVDGYTASAAEMIAGALGAYRRGVVLGGRTFGKGCIQEYVDDHAARGVLRVTTLVYALPDGSPVQRTGIQPDILLPTNLAREHESDLANALPSYRGPDVRELGSLRSVPWPSHRGLVGPCSDRSVCRALFRLGVPAQAQRPSATRRPSARALSTPR